MSFKLVSPPLTVWQLERLTCTDYHTRLVFASIMFCVTYSGGQWLMGLSSVPTSNQCVLQYSKDSKGSLWVKLFETWLYATNHVPTNEQTTNNALHQKIYHIRSQIISISIDSCPEIHVDKSQLPSLMSFFTCLESVWRLHCAWGLHIDVLPKCLNQSH